MKAIGKFLILLIPTALFALALVAIKAIITSSDTLEGIFEMVMFFVIGGIILAYLVNFGVGFWRMFDDDKQCDD